MEVLKLNIDTIYKTKIVKVKTQKSKMLKTCVSKETINTHQKPS